MAESMRRRLEKAETGALAPYATRSADARRRYPVENEGRAFDYRTEFQRDRDRIIYSRAFRRLRQKAVAGILPAYEDHRRNRLTHTLEVTQIARTIGRALRLNEDLVEAIALGHDLGQPAFGAAGERALDDVMSGRRDGRGGPGLGDLGGFRCATQALRVVDLVEKRYEHPGLNLSDPVREGILKVGPGRDVAQTEAAEFERETAGASPAGRHGIALEGLRIGCAPAFEAQIVRLADRAGSILHDLDDALQAGAADVSQVERLRIVVELRRKLGARYPQKASRFMRTNAIHRGLTHLLVTGAILFADNSLNRWAARHKVRDEKSFRGVRDALVTGNEIAFAPRLSDWVDDLDGFLEGRVRRSREADQVEGRGRRVVLGLFASYLADPSLLEDHVLLRYKEIARVRYLRDFPRGATTADAAGGYRRDPRFARVLTDYVAGMTDHYAVAEHRRLLEMGAVPIPSAEQLRREEFS